MSLAAAQPSATPPVASAGVDNLTCQWQGCTQPNHPSPEALYEHVCETHIGRKSTNNLNLQCFWGACRTTTVKRDHITSHIRVHVPLKPHKCDFCGKSFKRPQDLKKHVKTHADESVLLNSPQTGGGASRSHANGYHGQPNGKSSGFYGDGGMGPNMNYGGPGYPNMQTGGYGHYAGGMQGPHYGGPQYNIPQMSSYAGSGLTESRKRTHDALNEFFGNAKRSQIDPNSYQDLGARFGNVLGMMNPMGGGFQGGYMSGFGGGMDQGGGVAYQAQPAPMMQPGYGMAFPELRTKNDLLSIDQFLEQLQHTVYDNPADLAAHGSQPMATMVHTGMHPEGRGSHSPPRANSSVGTPSAVSSASQAAYSNMEETPALTPSSFQASHSPPSTQQNHSPTSRPAGSVGYPTLPSFHSLETQSNQFAQWPAGGVPPSGLGSQFEEYDNRRRGSGSKLQRARVSPPTDKPASPSSRRNSGEQDGGKNVEMTTPPHPSPVKLPGVAQITSGEAKRPGSDSDKRQSSSPEAEQSAHARNLRLIEGLRQYIRARLARNEYETEEDESGKATPRAQQSEDTEMVDADADDSSSRNGSTPKREGPGIAYPNLSKATEV